jgi:hypothetical protein
MGGAIIMQEEKTQGEQKDVLKQKDKFRWRENPPTVIRGDMREAFECGNNAENLKCDCWNTHCRFYGNCRKCLVFHLSIKQFPTCQREMLEELYTADLLDEELHIAHLQKRDGARSTDA